MENKGKNKLIRAVAFAVMTLCLLLTGQAWGLSGQHRLQQSELIEKVETQEQLSEADENVSEENIVAVLADAGRAFAGNATIPTCSPPKEDDPIILSKYLDLYEENEDFAGWLSIEGMKIDYPIMQCEDDEYYLHHDFYGEDSKYGSLYVKNQADLNEGTNFIIYGHNMKDGFMFGDLDYYTDESFYQEHPDVCFDTLYEERVYEIIAVFRSQVYNVEDEVFKYYKFYQADTQEEFDDFYRNIKELSLYNTGVEAEFGDTFLTLSTCAYHVENGRLVVVAKRRK